MAKLKVEDFEPQDEQIAYGTATNLVGGVKPKYATREWHDFIMSQFQEDELFNGYPKVDGLRRVTQEFLGDIIVSRPDILDTPRMDNGYRYVASHELIVVFWDDNKQHLFTELADVDLKNVNTPAEYAKHPTATASSKAEGRALRKALKLRTLAAEELGNPDYQDDEGMDFLVDDNPTDITAAQQSFIEFKCEKLGIDLKKLLAKSKAGYKNIEDLSYKDGERTIKYLNEIQINKKEVPASISKEG